MHPYDGPAYKLMLPVFKRMTGSTLDKRRTTANGPRDQVPPRDRLAALMMLKVREAC